MPLILDGTKGETFPSWTTATRPATPNAGQTGYNTTLATLEVYDGTNWRQSYLNSATSQASTSGTDIDFTGIPSWVKRITVIFNGVSSTAASSNLSIVIGSAGLFETSGYSSLSIYALGAGASGAAISTTAFISANSPGAADTVSGNITITNVSGNTWVSSGVLAATTSSYAWMSGGSKSTSATLDRVRVTTSAGTFDAGTINILYE